MALELLKYLGGVFTGGFEAGEDEQFSINGRFSEGSASQQPSNGPVVINGVALPQTVIDQLRQHGFNPEWCSRWELEAAEQESLVDGTVFHDPDGNDFSDDLELTEEEIEEDDDEIDPPPYRMNLHVRPDEDHEADHEKVLPIMSFREMEKRRRKEKCNHANDDGSHDME